jgi:hypothetical protein
MALRRDGAGWLDVDPVSQTSCCGNSYCEKRSEYLHEELLSELHTNMASRGYISADQSRLD